MLYAADSSAFSAAFGNLFGQKKIFGIEIILA
jgi:hypothetical protein